MPSKQQQADGEIHEDQLVNSIDEEVDLSLGNDAGIDAEDIYESSSARLVPGSGSSCNVESSETTIRPTRESRLST